MSWDEDLTADGGILTVFVADGVPVVDSSLDSKRSNPCSSFLSTVPGGVESIETSLWLLVHSRVELLLWWSGLALLSAAVGTLRDLCAWFFLVSLHCWFMYSANRNTSSMTASFAVRVVANECFFSRKIWMCAAASILAFIFPVSSSQSPESWELFVETLLELGRIVIKDHKRCSENYIWIVVKSKGCFEDMTVRIIAGRSTVRMPQWDEGKPSNADW